MHVTKRWAPKEKKTSSQPKVSWPTGTNCMPMISIDYS